jgi:hypothetical protein
MSKLTGLNSWRAGRLGFRLPFHSSAGPEIDSVDYRIRSADPIGVARGMSADQNFVFPAEVFPQ